MAWYDFIAARDSVQKVQHVSQQIDEGLPTFPRSQSEMDYDVVTLALLVSASRRLRSNNGRDLRWFKAVAKSLGMASQLTEVMDAVDAAPQPQ